MTAALLPDQRQAGILLHPTSLPSGRLGEDAIRWLDWLKEAGISVWQVLPIGVPLSDLSPYQSTSAFALDPNLFPATALDTDLQSGDARWPLFTRWYTENNAWLDDFALFMELKTQLGGLEWFHWPDHYRLRDPASLLQFRTDHAKPIFARIKQQFECWYQWQQLRQAAQQRGIRLFGDMPIFVAYDSADVWAHPERFLLDEQRHPTFVTGVPPDYFSETGQRWGNPHYNWDFMQAEQFQWWRERLRYHFDCFDLVRIDHFRGLEAVWMIPNDSETAINGHWQKVVGDQLLEKVQSEMGILPLVAEDLGIITHEVNALRNRFHLPGMAVLQFAFDHFADNPHKPHNVRENTVYYSGTHDNDTLLGWFNSLSTLQQDWARAMLSNSTDTTSSISALVMEALFASRAGLVMLPWQDLLELGSEARMNTPGTVGAHNWQWRFTWNQVPETLATTLRKKLAQHQRLQPQPDS
ncbi:4-alpha-glucanotransferase [Thiolinea disciformis]|uniref:4-alpha-glucanotransferase n=1 Tax=Thiolinea disciformis TaxID=125614 RepID=UPI000368E48C|nr:4-alpha-glucanotransferase [Thiolinea disciformis]